MSFLSRLLRRKEAGRGEQGRPAPGASAERSPEASAAPPTPSPVAAESASRLAALAMDLKERDVRIAGLLRELEAAKEAAKGLAQAAGDARILKLLKRLLPLFAQADAMRHFVSGGQTARVEDALTLVAKLEKAVLEEAGLDRIGETGAEAGFDPRLHQRLSGGDMSDGDAVVVRFVGYRRGETVIGKALVSRKEQA